MPGEPSAPYQVAHTNRWTTAVVSLAVGALFFALWFWLLPHWLGFKVETAGVTHWRWIVAVPDGRDAAHLRR